MSNPGDVNNDAGGSGNGRTVPPPLDFEDENGIDGPKAVEKIDSIKITWDQGDLKFFFTELEDAMDLISIKSQWLKRQVLARTLTPLVKAEVKDLLIKKKSEVGTDIYKQLKLRLLHLFGPKTEDAFEEACSLVLTGKPSALAKRLIVLLCECKKPLDGCCCAKVVEALWKRQLPAIVRAGVAGRSLGKELEKVLDKADDIYASQAARSGAVSAVSLDETLPALQSASVAAVKKKVKPKGDRGAGHPDGPPENACFNHWTWGKSAYYCKKRSACPWKQFTKPKPKPNNSDA